MKITDNSQQLNEHDLNALEKRLGRAIPPSYRNFLLKYNGGRPNPSEFKMTRLRDSKIDIGAVKFFLGVNMPEETLGIEYNLLTFQGRIPNTMFPIARDPGGNLICTSTEGNNSGKVYFWDHEYEAGNDEPLTEENLYFIADNFDKFLNKLSETN